MCELSALARFITGTQNRNAVVCRNCLHLFSRKQHLSSHVKYCKENEAVAIQLPKEGDILKFNDYSARYPLPIICVFDFETLVVPVHTAQNNPEASSTTIIQHHVPCSFALAVIERKKSCPTIYFDRSPDCMRKFVETLEQLAHEIYAMKQRYPEFTGEIPSNADLDTCWICEESFKEMIREFEIIATLPVHS